MVDLPDFLLLPEADVARELKRQENLRRDFNSRARLSPVEIEMARSLVIEKDLRHTLEQQTGEELRAQTQNQLADVIAAQGRFTEAASLTSDEQTKEFYTKAGKAIWDSEECADGERVEAVGQDRLRMPKYRVLKQAYSLKTGQFGFLCECNTCGNFVFLSSDPTPEQIDPADFDIAKTPNDLQRLKV